MLKYHAELSEFIDNVEFKPLQANNAERLAQLIKWASTAVVKSASAPVSQSAESGAVVANVPIPEPPAEEELLGSVEDVW